MDIKTRVDLDKLKFREKDALGEGFFGKVYRVTDGVKYDDRFVAKVFHTPKVLAMINKTHGVSFEGETMALKELGPENVSPKIYYEKNTFLKRYYVMEAMSGTLSDILIHDYFTRDHLHKLTSLLQRLFETQYRHADLHVNNIMWSDRLNDFRIVDWGMYDIDTRNNATSSIKKMIRSGDMFNLIQLYVTYRIDIVNDSEEYWKKSYEEFLRLVPKDEILSEKFTPKQIKHRIKVGIIDYLKPNTTNTPRRSRLKSKKHNSNKLRFREAEKLLGEQNTAFREMQNLSTRRRSSRRRSTSSRSSSNKTRDVYRSSSSSNQTTSKRRSRRSRSLPSLSN